MLCDKTSQCTADVLIPHARKDNHSSFPIPTLVGGRRPLPSKICAQTGPPFRKTPTSTDSAYIVSTVKSSIKTNRKSTTGFPTSCRWSLYDTLSPQMVAQKAIFVFLKIKPNFRRIKSATKFLSVKTSSGRVVYSINIPLCNGP